MASKKLRPGSFKGGKKPVRRTGRTTGISQSAFAGYGFQTSQQATSPTQKKDEMTGEESTDKTDAEDVSRTDDCRATSTPAEGSNKKADETQSSSD